jgi:hypothetical protein
MRRAVQWEGKETDMKLLIPLLALATLSGCVAYPYNDNGPYYSGRAYDGRHAYRYDRDRDHDGVPNRYDRAPDNPRRY